MSLSPGTRLGPYEIHSHVGTGGMGEVYRATDTRLDRTVAIKVLPGHVANDPDLRQRFEREVVTGTTYILVSHSAFYEHLVSFVPPRTLAKSDTL